METISQQLTRLQVEITAMLVKGMEVMAYKFEIGEIVLLKSGGPKMTVVSVVARGLGCSNGFRCTWFEGGQVESQTFPAETLLLAPPCTTPEADLSEAPIG